VPLFHSSPEAHFSSARPENKPNPKNLQSSGVRRARARVRVLAFARAQAERVLQRRRRAGPCAIGRARALVLKLGLRSTMASVSSCGGTIGATIGYKFSSF
jgi:hypothetical protein